MDVTARGAEFVEHSRAVLAAIDAVSSVASSGLVVAMRASVGSGLVAAVANDPAFRRGGVSMQIQFTHAPELAVRTGAADIALMCSTHDATGLTAQEIDVEPTAALMRSSGVLAGATSTTMQHLVTRPGFTAAIGL